MHCHIGLLTDFPASNLYVCLLVFHWMAWVLFKKERCSFQFLCLKPSVTLIYSSIKPTLLSRWLKVIYNLPIFYSCIILPCLAPRPPISAMAIPDCPHSHSELSWLLPSFPSAQEASISLHVRIPQGLVKYPLLSSISGQISLPLICGFAALCFDFYYSNADFYPVSCGIILISTNLSCCQTVFH